MVLSGMGRRWVKIWVVVWELLNEGWSHQVGLGKWTVKVQPSINHC